MRAALPTLPVRLAAVLLGLALAAAGAPAMADAAWRIDTPGALERIHAARPDHYRKIVVILDSIQDQPERKVAQWMSIRFDAKEVDYHPLLLVSLPPKRKLSFALDGVHYAGIIVLDKYQADLFPLD